MIAKAEKIHNSFMFTARKNYSFEFECNFESEQIATPGDDAQSELIVPGDCVVGCLDTAQSAFR
jgi:hypothetical protein